MKTKEANAGWITRSLVDTFLITHPHLDHISGFVVNTAGLGGTRPKRLAGLPGTVEAFKNHIFNVSLSVNLSVLCTLLYVMMKCVCDRRCSFGRGEKRSCSSPRHERIC